MSPDIFILTLGLYLFCVVASLLFAIFHKKITDLWAVVFFILHIVLGIGFVVTELITDKQSGFSVLFMFFFCCGILTAGLFIRRIKYKWIKLYSLIYLFSVVFFLVSPSKMVGFIATGQYDYYQPDRFHVFENIYLIEAVNLMDQGSTGTTYKIIREMGMYHRTIERNIDIPFNIKAVSLEKFQKDTLLIIKVVPIDPRHNEIILKTEMNRSNVRSKITKGK